VSDRLRALGIRDKVLLVAGGRIAEKEEEHAMFEKKIAAEGPGFLGVDRFYGPGSDLDVMIKDIDAVLVQKGA
jgi:2-methyleneglutarate mutase